MHRLHREAADQHIQHQYFAAGLSQSCDSLAHKGCAVCRWTKLEDKREHAENEQKAQAELDAGRGVYIAEAQTHLEEVASRNQIFNVREAFAMLSRELSDMMRDMVWPSPLSPLLPAASCLETSRGLT